MCGIIGYVGKKNAAGVMLEGLRKLEYRGYDSAGMAVVSDGVMGLRKCSGRIESLTRLLKQEPLGGHIGVSHTR
jgi:glucosamine--fructose-6-phosphate aminotransferase (isomerizing)